MLNKIILIISFLLPVYLKAQIITTIAGGGIGGDGSMATDARLDDPTAITFDNQGNIYISERTGKAVRKISYSNGIISTFAGGTYIGDGQLADITSFDASTAIFDSNYNYLYIPDIIQNKVRRVNMFSNIVSSTAGTGVANFSGGGFIATSATLNAPTDICFDKFGNTYIADCANCRIRKINSAGIISTYVGNGIIGTLGDNIPATNAELDDPSSICTDDNGNLYIADAGDVRIRKVSTLGIISTVAGNSSGVYYNGDNIPATLANIAPAKILYHLGSLYITDFVNKRIRMIDSLGIIHTVAGNGMYAFSGDGGPADSASLNGPAGIAFDACNNLYITEVAGVNGGRVRKVTFDSTCKNNKAEIKDINNADLFSIYPNPAFDFLNIKYNKVIEEIVITNIEGKTLIKQVANNNQTEINIKNLPLGFYNVIVNNKMHTKFIKQ